MIDPDALRRLRTDRGLSQRRLAAAIGVDPLTVKRLEDGADPGDLPLRVVERLTTTLGTDLQQLLQRTEEVATDRDDLAAAIGAALLAHGRTTITRLAAALSATSDQVIAAVSTLGTLLQHAGMSTARHHDELWLVPRTHTVVAMPHNRPLNIAEARLLRRIHRGEDVRRALSAVDRQVTLPALLRRQLVTDQGNGPDLTETAELSLTVPCPGQTRQ